MNTEKIKSLLRSLLVEASNVMTDKGNLFYEGDELAVDTAVFSDEEMTTPMEDGDYETDDKVFTVADGKVAEIKEKEAEEPEAEETEETVEAEDETPEEEEVKEEPTEEVVEDNSEIEALKAEIEEIKKAIEEINAKLAEPVVEPIVEEFSKVNKGVDWSNIRKVAREWK